MASGSVETAAEGDYAKQEHLESLSKGMERKTSQWARLLRYANSYSHHVWRVKNVWRMLWEVLNCLLLVAVAFGYENAHPAMTEKGRILKGLRWLALWEPFSRCVSTLGN